VKEIGKIGPFQVVKYYFEAPPAMAGLGLAKVFHSPRKPTGFLAQRRYTLLIDLTLGEEGLLSGMRSTWRRHIKQAEALGAEFQTGVSKDEFVSFFNHFAEQKGLSPFDPREDLLFTRMQLDGTTYTFHAYSRDVQKGWVRLRHSSSIRLDEGADTERVALVNKRHHYLDFLFFAGLGYRSYDFGGCQGPNAPKASPLHFFKTGFGGQVVEDWQGVSLPLAMLDRLVSLARGIKTSISSKKR
jgi:hypothetical protein